MKGIVLSAGVRFAQSKAREFRRRTHVLRWTASLIPRPGVAAAVWGAILGVAVCFPLFHQGTLFLLDWSIGRHVGIVTAPSLGLTGLTISTPFAMFEAVLVHLLGGFGTWLPLMLFFPLAAYSIAKLAGGSIWCQLGAATLYCLNPFVFNRIYAGHLPLLIGYALLPLATLSVIRARDSKQLNIIAPAFWWAVLTALSVHFLWIFAIVMVAVALSSRHKMLRSLKMLVINMAIFAVTCAYLILPHLVTTLPVTIGHASLEVFRTSGDPRFGLFLNVIGLYGFWRLGPGPVLPKSYFPGWPLVLLAILLVCGAGIVSMMRNSKKIPAAKPDSRNLAIILSITGVLGILLAMGDQGPTGALFRLAYFHLPFFNIMREPEKFSMLIALALAVFLGNGVDRMLSAHASAKRGSRAFMGFALCVVLPLSYTPNILGALDGQIALSKVPNSWSVANSIMGSGQGKVLALPWHEYLSFPFSGNRVVLNPLSTSLTRDVISGDNLQTTEFQSNSTSLRSTYLQQLFGLSREIHNFGQLVSPLGVKYILLSKTVDWADYRWLNKQTDLRLILNTDNLELWRNLRFDGVGSSSDSLSRVRDVRQLVSRSLSNPSSIATARFDRSPHVSTNAPHGTRQVREISPIQYDVSSGQAGWVEIDSPYEPGWSTHSSKGIPSAEGTVLIKVGSGATEIKFGSWVIVRLGYLVSAATFGAMALLLLFGYWSRRRPRADAGRDKSAVTRD